MLVLLKRKSFQYENEVRLFYKRIKGFSRDLYTQSTDGRGSYVGVDINSIIRDIYIDPTAAPWFKELVEEFCRRNGLPDRVRKSRLMLEPEYDDCVK